MLIQLIGHTTYALLTLSYLVRDIYLLRLIAIPASLCSITFCYFSSPEPVWLIIGWNVLFLTVNVYQVASLHLKRLRLNESGELTRFVELVGSAIPVSDVAVLLEHGEIREFEHPTKILAEGKRAKRIYLVWAGPAPTVTVRGKHAGRIEPGEFVGEIGFLTNEPCTATVYAAAGTKLVWWDRRLLAGLLHRRPSLRNSFNTHLAIQLRKKLQTREQEIASLHVEPQLQNDELIAGGIR